MEQNTIDTRIVLLIDLQSCGKSFKSAKTAADLIYGTALKFLLNKAGTQIARVPFSTVRWAWKLYNSTARKDLSQKFATLTTKNFERFEKTLLTYIESEFQHKSPKTFGTRSTIGKLIVALTDTCHQYEWQQHAILSPVKTVGSKSDVAHISDNTSRNHILLFSSCPRSIADMAELLWKPEEKCADILMRTDYNSIFPVSLVSELCGVNQVNLLWCDTNSNNGCFDKRVIEYFDSALRSVFSGGVLPIGAIFSIENTSAVPFSVLLNYYESGGDKHDHLKDNIKCVTLTHESLSSKMELRPMSATASLLDTCPSQVITNITACVRRGDLPLKYLATDHVYYCNPNAKDCESSTMFSMLMEYLSEHNLLLVVAIQQYLTILQPLTPRLATASVLHSASEAAVKRHVAKQALHAAEQAELTQFLGSVCDRINECGVSGTVKRECEVPLDNPTNSCSDNLPIDACDGWYIGTGKPDLADVFEKLRSNLPPSLYVEYPQYIKQVAAAQWNQQQSRSISQSGSTSTPAVGPADDGVVSPEESWRVKKLRRDNNVSDRTRSLIQEAKCVSKLRRSSSMLSINEETNTQDGGHDARVCSSETKTFDSEHALVDYVLSAYNNSLCKEECLIKTARNIIETARTYCDGSQGQGVDVVKLLCNHNILVGHNELRLLYTGGGIEVSAVRVRAFQLQILMRIELHTLDLPDRIPPTSGEGVIPVWDVYVLADEIAVLMRSMSISGALAGNNLISAFLLQILPLYCHTNARALLKAVYDELVRPLPKELTSPGNDSLLSMAPPDSVRSTASHLPQTLFSLGSDSDKPRSLEQVQHKGRNLPRTIGFTYREKRMVKLRDTKDRKSNRAQVAASCTAGKDFAVPNQIPCVRDSKLSSSQGNANTGELVSEHVRCIIEETPLCKVAPGPLSKDIGSAIEPGPSVIKETPLVMVRRSPRIAEHRQQQQQQPCKQELFYNVGVNNKSRNVGRALANVTSLSNIAGEEFGVGVREMFADLTAPTPAATALANPLPPATDIHSPVSSRKKVQRRGAIRRSLSTAFDDSLHDTSDAVTLVEEVAVSSCSSKLFGPTTAAPTNTSPPSPPPPHFYLADASNSPAEEDGGADIHQTGVDILQFDHGLLEADDVNSPQPLHDSPAEPEKASIIEACADAEFIKPQAAGTTVIASPSDVQNQQQQQPTSNNVTPVRQQQQQPLVFPNCTPVRRSVRTATPSTGKKSIAGTPSKTSSSLTLSSYFIPTKSPKVVGKLYRHVAVEPSTSMCLGTADQADQQPRSSDNRGKQSPVETTAECGTMESKIPANFQPFRNVFPVGKMEEILQIGGSATKSLKSDDVNEVGKEGEDDDDTVSLNAKYNEGSMCDVQLHTSSGSHSHDAAAERISAEVRKKCQFAAAAAVSTVDWLEGAAESAPDQSVEGVEHSLFSDPHTTNVIEAVGEKRKGRNSRRKKVNVSRKRKRKHDDTTAAVTDCEVTVGDELREDNKEDGDGHSPVSLLSPLKDVDKRWNINLADNKSNVATYSKLSTRPTIDETEEDITFKEVVNDTRKRQNSGETGREYHHTTKRLTRKRSRNAP